MEEISINVSGCITALQFLDRVGKAFGTPLGNFSALNQYLLHNYYPKIIFVGMGEFWERCPHAMKEIEMILERVKSQYQKEGKEFEYELL